MIKYLLILVLVVIGNVSFGANVKIKTKPDVEITFDSFSVDGGSFDSQIFVVDSSINAKNVIGFADIGGGFGSYKGQLPIQSSYDNVSHYFIVSLAYSEEDKAVICTRECWNNSDEGYEFPELSFVLNWMVVKYPQ